ncbi:hypothetical protein APICC_04041 [Apis cerana cerana]|uniref:Uncharacterized protein n=1 Tax=Apis cerana cerana TaxID=94128 RepID=A0A2A3ER29_APICC|nr:hypothetical protein APICC_04041 [Apis cerana cerana]
MKSRVNLVAILLTLSCAARVLEGLKSDEKHSSHKEYYPVGKKIVKEVHNKAAPQSAALLRIEDKTKILKSKNTGFGLSKDYFHGPVCINASNALSIVVIFNDIIDHYWVWVSYCIPFVVAISHYILFTAWKLRNLDSLPRLEQQLLQANRIVNRKSFKQRFEESTKQVNTGERSAQSSGFTLCMPVTVNYAVFL